MDHLFDNGIAYKTKYICHLENIYEGKLMWHINRKSARAYTK